MMQKWEYLAKKVAEYGQKDDISQAESDILRDMCKPLRNFY